MHKPSSPTTTIYPAGTLVPQLHGTYEIAFGDTGDNSLVTTSTLAFGHGSEGGTIIFTENDDYVPLSGVYQGDAGNAVAPTDGSGNAITTDYLAAEPDNTVTIHFNSTQEYFGLLWGSMNDGNTLDFYDGNKLVASICYNGTDLVTSFYEGGKTVTSETPEYIDSTQYVSISLPCGFTSVVASSSSGGFEFTNITYSSHIPSGEGGCPVIVMPYDDCNPHCFLEGTLIATSSGQCPVEALQIGDVVLTSLGREEAVRWIGHRKIASRFADRLSSFPVRISAGALADAIPARDLCLSPEHAVLVDGILINAGALVNGVSITREAVMPEIFSYYHVELASHDLILAEGTAAETFVDNADRGQFDNWATHPGDVATGEMQLPRAKGFRQVPSSIRRKLQARAERFMPTGQAA